MARNEKKKFLDLAELAQQHTLPELVELLEQPGQLELFLQAGANFCDGIWDFGKARKDTTVPNDTLPLVIGVLDYASALVDIYAEDAYGLFMDTLGALVYLEPTKKYQCITSFEGLFRKDAKVADKRDKLMPEIVREIIVELADDYRQKFATLQEKELGKKSGRYERFIEELAQDLDRLFAYAHKQIDLHAKFDPMAEQISFQDCYPGKGGNGDGKKYHPAFVSSLIDGGGSPADLIGEWGAPIGTIPHSVRDGRVTIAIFWGNETKQYRVPIVHPDGLTTKARDFYSDLLRRFTPIESLAEGTRNTARLLRSGS